MKKLAIFAEGGTEQHFIENLIRSIAGSKNIRIEKTKTRGGRSRRETTRLEIDAASNAQKYYVVIQDCGGDESVQSDVRDNYSSLCESNYDAIIGMRDVYPKTGIEMQKVKNYLYFRILQTPIKALMVLAIMEVEAWFIAETGHFARINKNITKNDIISKIGFDPDVDPARVEEIRWPTGSLNEIYECARERYDKNDPHNLARTASSLDYDRVYLDLADKIPAMKPLIEELNSFLS